MLDGGSGRDVLSLRVNGISRLDVGTYERPPV